MKEVEVKILEINVKQIEQKIKDLGAEKVFDGEVKSIYYKVPKKAFRLRKLGDKTELCIKEKISNGVAKIRNEIEVNVTDFEKTKLIINKLGFKIKYELKKHRISYKLNDVKFELDTYKGIPTFLEIETQDEKTIKKYIQLLGFQPKDAKPWSTKDLFKHYNKTL